MINFPFETKGKLMVLGVPILKHFRVIQRYFFLFSLKSCCDLSLEPSCQGGFNEGSQPMFLWKNKENYS